MHATAAPILEVSGLTKRFGEKTVVDGISFSVEKGGLFAFLGQNGAGKTTSINMITGLLRRDGGEIRCCGSTDLAVSQNKRGVVFQNSCLDDLLTVEENLMTHGALYIKSRKRVRARYGEVVALLSLGDVAKQRFKTLSGGQKRRAEIARALFMSPELLFLDEPTTGLDPKTRAEVWEVIHRLKANGMTVFLTTHYMEETACADRVAIIDHGKIAAEGSPAELKSRYASDRLLLIPEDAPRLERQLKEWNVAAHRRADTYAIQISSAAASIDLLHRLKENIRFYEVRKGSMDDVFLNVIGSPLRKEEESA
ncbi:MAG: ABC transporter ATP-binding protein [Oscillospiraceae bacterium]|jgi:multidrug/hemolysin transport system ATP-binding protein|nr:ABC transporter ATP-binding protein [Oscillospiraceae bacterium]